MKSALKFWIVILLAVATSCGGRSGVGPRSTPPATDPTGGEMMPTNPDPLLPTVSIRGDGKTLLPNSWTIAATGRLGDRKWILLTAQLETATSRLVCNEYRLADLESDLENEAANIPPPSEVTSVCPVDLTIDSPAQVKMITYASFDDLFLAVGYADNAGPGTVSDIRSRYEIAETAETKIAGYVIVAGRWNQAVPSSETENLLEFNLGLDGSRSLRCRVPDTLSMRCK